MNADYHLRLFLAPSFLMYWKLGLYLKRRSILQSTKFSVHFVWALIKTLIGLNPVCCMFQHLTCEGLRTKSSMMEYPTKYVCSTIWIVQNHRYYAIERRWVLSSFKAFSCICMTCHNFSLYHLCLRLHSFLFAPSWNKQFLCFRWNPSSFACNTQYFDSKEVQTKVIF